MNFFGFRLQRFTIFFSFDNTADKYFFFSIQMPAYVCQLLFLYFRRYIALHEIFQDCQNMVFLFQTIFSSFNKACVSIRCCIGYFSVANPFNAATASKQKILFSHTVNPYQSSGDQPDADRRKINELLVLSRMPA